MAHSNSPQRNLRQRRRQNLNRLLRPRHIAFIGGSQAASAVAVCRRGGYKGAIWTVNPRRSEIAGIRTVARIEDLPAPPDAALVALSPEGTIDAVASLNAVGAGGAVCMAAGFAELGPAGAALQITLKEAAGDLAVVGPNCMGILNQFDGAAVWGSDNHIEPVAGDGAAIISQSGALIFGMTNVEQAFPLGYGISIGNQAVVDMADCIEAVLDDSRVKAIGLYVEGIEDGDALGAACWRALQQGIPIVALKGGDTPAGQSIALTHTGALIVERDLWEGFAKRYGIVEVSSPKAMVETVKLLTIGGVPAGGRLSVVTYSGGLNGLVAADAPRHGLSLPAPTVENGARLRERMPETVPVANPLDLNLPWRSRTGLSMEDGQEVAEGIVELAADVADMVVFFLDVPRVDENRLDADWLPTVMGMAHVAKTLKIPTAVAGTLPEGLDVGLRQRLLAAGVIPLLGYRDAFEAFSVAARLASVFTAKRHAAAPPPLLLVNQSAADAVEMLDEVASKALLAPFGVQSPAGWSGPPSEAPAAAARIGFPVVAKLISTQIAHKAAAGGVYLNLQTEAAVAEAVEAMVIAVPRAVPGHAVERVLIEQMVDRPVAEFIIGIKRHPTLGLALLLGRGGSNVEQLRRFATMLLPLEKEALDSARNELGIPVNGHGWASLRAVAQAVAAFAIENKDQVVSLDVNPVIITADATAIAADALIIMQN